jgi:Mn2+/Fe2+ NRAMP family transporter
MAGTVNGITLPLALAIILLAANRIEIIGDYKHPRWLQVAGWLVVVLMFAMVAYTMRSLIFV